MRRVTSLGFPSLTVLLAALFLAGIDVPAAAQEAWVEVKSPHFTIVSNAGQGRAGDVAWQFEQFRGGIEMAWPWAGVRLDRPVFIIAAKDEATMKALLPAYWERPADSRPGGLLVTSADRHYIVVRTDVRADDRANMNPHITAYWSYAFTLDAAFDRGLPLWFRIGMAEVLSNTIVRDTELRFGLPIPGHLERIRQGRLRLRELLDVNSASEHSTDGENRRRFYAQCWTVLHYLLFGRPEDRAGRVNELARLLLGGKPSAAAVEEVLGSLDALETAYMRYTQQSVFQFSRLKIDGPSSSRTLATRDFAAHESAAIRAAFYVATNRPVEARTSIAAARKASAESAGSYEAEALLLDREEKGDDARAAFIKATELSSTNAYAHYRLAALTWGTNPDAETLGRIETLLRRAVALNDGYAPAYTLLADAVARGSQPQSALDFATKAASLEPGDPAPRLALARVLWRLSRRDEARGHALAARQLADTEQERNEVQLLLDFFARAPAN